PFADVEDVHSLPSRRLAPCDRRCDRFSLMRARQPRDARLRSRWATLLIAAVAWVVALAAIALYLVISPLLPPRVHVRWSEAASDAQRMQIEHELGLTAGERQQG